jgi:hypothetical protein
MVGGRGGVEGGAVEQEIELDLVCGSIPLPERR